MTYSDASYASVPYAAGADFGTFSQALYRSLELQANRAIQVLTPAPYRALEVVANRAIWAQTAGLYRGLELLDNRAIQALVAGLYRALTTLESYTNDPMFPWLFALRPNQQYRSGQVALVGDGGDFVVTGAFNQQGTTSALNTPKGYLRLDRNGSNQWTMYASHDRTVWMVIGTANYAKTFTVAQLGVRFGTGGSIDFIDVVS